MIYLYTAYKCIKSKKPEIYDTVARKVMKKTKDVKLMMLTLEYSCSPSEEKKNRQYMICIIHDSLISVICTPG